MWLRGDSVVVKDIEVVLTIAGPQDFEGYEYNRPTDQWELVMYPDGIMVWIGNIWLRRNDGKDYQTNRGTM